MAVGVKNPVAIYYRLWIYHGYIWYDNAHSTTITMIKLSRKICTHERHPIPRPFGRNMGCLSWVKRRKMTPKYRERNYLLDVLRRLRMPSMSSSGTFLYGRVGKCLQPYNPLFGSLQKHGANKHLAWNCLSWTNGCVVPTEIDYV